MAVIELPITSQIDTGTVLRTVALSLINQLQRGAPSSLGQAQLSEVSESSASGHR